MHTVKVFNDSCKVIPAHVEIGGKTLGYCKSIDYHADINTVPTFVFEVCALADIEVNHADICFKFHPETVTDAVKILRHELMLHSEVYDGFLGSVKSVLNDMYDDAYSINKAAEKILQRMIGDNDK